MTRSDSICFGLLAGGQSRRMGADKAALDWRGQALWQHQLRLAREISAHEVLISGRPGGPYCNAAKIIPDEIPNLGPLGGLSALLNAMSSDWLVAVAVDMPFLDVTTLRELLATRSGLAGVVPAIGERAEPLAAVYPRAARELVAQRLQLADRSLQSFVRAAAEAGLVRLLPWPAEGAGVFRSVNTPEEFAAAQAR
ncbi:MAG: molybdenum cofactor guanylyltransferase [Verrucomicrobia bacterium]|nr:MAG: molybdenum cofactor guanylyltransferase [Verrucomicrobiota bacterium]